MKVAENDHSLRNREAAVLSYLEDLDEVVLDFGSSKDDCVNAKNYFIERGYDVTSRRILGDVKYELTVRRKE